MKKEWETWLPMWVMANLSKTFEKTYTKLRLKEHDTEMGDRCQESHPRGKNKMKMLERKNTDQIKKKTLESY